MAKNKFDKNLLKKEEEVKVDIQVTEEEVYTPDVIQETRDVVDVAIPMDDETQTHENMEHHNIACASESCDVHHVQLNVASTKPEATVNLCSSPAVIPEPEPEGGKKPMKKVEFGGFYKVTNPKKNGQTFIEGDSRRIPCYSINLNLEEVKRLAKDGYTLELLSNPVVAEGYPRINKRNIDAFVTKIENMIEYGFI